jgi:hypothetical protein
MACSDEDRDRSRRPGVEDWGWSHRSGTWWSSGREIRWCRVWSAPGTWRLGARVSWLILKTKVDDFWRFGLKTCCDGFRWFGLKTSGDGFLKFGLKTGGDGFSRFGLKTGGWVSWLSLKTKVDGL